MFLEKRHEFIILLFSFPLQQQINSCKTFPQCMGEKKQSGVSGMDLVKAKETCSTDFLKCIGKPDDKIEGCWVSVSPSTLFKL